MRLVESSVSMEFCADDLLLKGLPQARERTSLQHRFTQDKDSFWNKNEPEKTHEINKYYHQ